MTYDSHFRNGMFVILFVLAKIIAKAFFAFPHVSVVYFGYASSKINLCDRHFWAGKNSTQFDKELCKYIFGRDTPLFHGMVILL